MLDLLLYLLAIVAVLCIFGLPAVLLVLPEEWRGWWPVVLPIAGMAVLACIVQPLGTIFSVGGVIWPSIAIALIATGFAWHRAGGPGRPAAAALLALVAIMPAVALAYRPSLESGVPRPSGVLNEDSIYYLGVEQWLERNGIRDAPPTPDIDGFYATASNTYDDHLRVGVDLANITASKWVGVDPLDTLPALQALLIGFAALAVGLLLLAMRAPPWAAVLGVLLIAFRPDLLRLGVDSFIAQLAGLTLGVSAIAALGPAMLRGGARRIGMAALLVSGLIAYYVEYAPAVVLTGVALALGGALWTDGALPTIEGLPRPLRRRLEPLRRGAIVGVIAFALNPLAVINGVRSLSESAGLSGTVIVPFFQFPQKLTLILGPFSLLRDTGSIGLVVAIAASVLALIGLLLQRREAFLGLGAGAAAVALLCLYQEKIEPYSYGLYKLLALAAPFAVAGLVVAIASRARGVAVVAASAAVMLLALNVVAAREISRDSIAGFNGMIEDDAQLAKLRGLARAGESVALQGTDLEGVPNARQHYGVYWLRNRLGLRVTYARGPGSYYTTGLARGPADVDATYRADYRYVVSYGPSFTHGRPVRRFGGWYVYRRNPVDLLVIGREAWKYPAVLDDGTPVRWSRGDGLLWLNAPRAARVRLALRLVSPAGPRRASVVVNGRSVGLAAVRPSGTTLVTRPFDAPAGRSIVQVVSRARPVLVQDPASALGVGLVQARAVVAP